VVGAHNSQDSRCRLQSGTLSEPPMGARRTTGIFTARRALRLHMWMHFNSSVRESPNLLVYVTCMSPLPDRVHGAVSNVSECR
jgi:hypothetical protein